MSGLGLMFGSLRSSGINTTTASNVQIPSIFKKFVFDNEYFSVEREYFYSVDICSPRSWTDCPNWTESGYRIIRSRFKTIGKTCQSNCNADEINNMVTAYI